MRDKITHTENYQTVIFNVVLSRFSEARKIKRLSFLQIRGFVLFMRKNIISFELSG